MRKFSIAAAACAGAFVVAAIPVLAQISPNDTGAGVRRGMQDMNVSGQVGSVTLYRRNGGSGTLVVIDVQGQRPGHIESASIQRGKSCSESDIDNTPVWKLNDVSHGRSATVVNASEDRLLSGNYVVIVHAGNVMTSKSEMARKSSWQPSLCGQLYPGS